MKLVSIMLLASTAVASPLGGPHAFSDFVKRQFGGSSITSNELEDGACKKVTFIFVRTTIRRNLLEHRLTSR